MKENEMKIIAVFVAVTLLFATPIYAGDLFVSHQSSLLMPEDDNFGYGKGFFAQGAEAGYSWKYAEIGAEYFMSNLKTLHHSTFTDNSIIGTIKIKYPLPWKRVNRFAPYAVIGAGSHFFTNKKMKKDPDQPDNEWNTPETIARSSCIALKYGAGIQYKVTDKISIFGEVAYRYGDTGKPSSIDIYAWSYGGGIRINF